MNRPLFVPILLIVAAVTVAVLIWLGTQPDATTPEESSGSTTLKSRQDAPSPRARSHSRSRSKPKTGKPTSQNDAFHKIWIEDTYENNLVGHLLKPFNHRELLALAAKPKSQRNDHLLVRLILRATGERDASFRDLLERTDLRKDSSIDMALEAYDYAINGNRSALERILAKHRANIEDGSAGWGTNAVWVLGSIDEWDLTLQALQAHSMSGDGAGGGERYAFWLTRRFHFPDHPSFPRDYQEFYRIVYGEK